MRTLKVLIVIPIVLLFYFLTVVCINIFLHNYNVFNSIEGIKFEDIYLDYLLNLRIKGMSYSNENLSFSSKEVYVSFDFRKLFINKFPFGLLKFKDTEIRFVGSSKENLTTNVDYSYYLEKLSKTKFLFDDVKFYYGDLGLVVDKFRVNFSSSSILSFDLSLDLSYGLGDVVKFLGSSISFSGIALRKSNDQFDFSGRLELKSNEIMGFTIDDLRMTLFSQDGSLVGISVSESYNAELRYKDGAFSANLIVNNLTNLFNHFKSYEYFSVFPDLKEILYTSLRDFSISLFVSNDYLSFNISGANIFGFFKTLSNETYAYLSYSNPSNNKSFLLEYSNENSRIVINDFRFFNYDLDLRVNFKIKEGNFSFYDSYVKFGKFNAALLNNLTIFSNNFIGVTNSYLLGSVDLNSFSGKLLVKSTFLKSLIPNLDYLFDGLDSELILSNHILYISSVNNYFRVSLFCNLSNENIKIDKFDYYPLDLSLRGNLNFRDRISADLLLRLGNNFIPINLSFNKNDIYFDLKGFGFCKVSTNLKYFHLLLTNFLFADVNFNKIFLYFSDGSIDLSTIFMYRGFKFNMSSSGTLGNLRIKKSYIYTPQKIIEFSGDLSFTDNLVVNLYSDDSKVSINSEDLKGFSIYGSFKNFHFPYLIGIPLESINGSFSVYLDITKTNFYEIFEKVSCDLRLDLLGMFYKSLVKINKNNNILDGNISLFDYFNIFDFRFYYQDRKSLVSKLLIYPRIQREFYVPQVISFNGWFQDDVLLGKLDVNIREFSGLNEIWSRDVSVSRDDIAISGSGDGINFYKTADNIFLSYSRGGKVLYILKGVMNKESITGNLSGRVPLGFILIPDFITTFKGDLFVDDLKFTLRGNKVELTGDAKLVVDNLKVAMIDNSLKVDSALVKFYGNGIIVDSGILYNGLGKLGISAKLDLQNFSNPFFDVKLMTLGGKQNFYINIGTVELKGPGTVSINLFGTFDNPVISGNLSFSKNSQVKFYFLSSEENFSDEKEFFNFAQISTWQNFTISLEEGVSFESEIINSQTEKGQVVVNGKVLDKSLSLSGLVDLARGTMRYINKLFDVDYIRLIFNGEEFNFIPYVVGEVFSYVFDSSSQENVKITMKISGKANRMESIFYSQPERNKSEILSLLGIPTKSSELVREGISLLETIGIYDFISYNVRKYTGLDLFYVSSPIISSYLISLLENQKDPFTFRDIMRLTELRIGKSILPTLFFEYRLGFDTIGSLQGYTNVLLHNFSVDWYFRSLLFEFEYSSSVKNDRIEFEPRFNIKFNKRF